MTQTTYTYVSRKESKPSRKQFTNIMIKLHRNIKKDYKVTFEDRLIGSAGRKCAMKEEPANLYDYDFNLIVHKKNGYDDANQLHSVFEKALKAYAKEYNKNTTNKMTIDVLPDVFRMRFSDESTRYSCDIAIIEDHSEKGK